MRMPLSLAVALTTALRGPMSTDAHVPRPVSPLLRRERRRAPPPFPYQPLHPGHLEFAPGQPPIRAVCRRRGTGSAQGHVALSTPPRHSRLAIPTSAERRGPTLLRCCNPSPGTAESRARVPRETEAQYVDLLLYVFNGTWTKRGAKSQPVGMYCIASRETLHPM